MRQTKETENTMKKFNITKHGDRKSGRWITADHLHAAKERAVRLAGVSGTEDYAWETSDAGHVYLLYVIRSHRIVRSYTLRPDWR
jgi:hypothetical protein